MDMWKAKEVIAHFLNIEIYEIEEATVMNHTMVSSSLLLHRMYAVLADKGYVLEDPSSIVTYGDFRKALNSDVGKSTSSQSEIINQFNDKNIYVSTTGIGIDIEEISNLPAVQNFSTDRFYIDNFSTYEIEYCMIKKNPLKSFAAIFSLKEAIIKADNSFLGKKFNQINIMHTTEGKPKFKNFILSTSHTNDLVVSVAFNTRKINKNSSLSDDKLGIMPDVKKYSKFDKANYFTRTQTIFILILITFPIYIILYLSTII